MAVSERVSAICREHFGAGCRRCPIPPTCHRPVVPLTYESLAAWRKALDDAADVAAGGKAGA